MIVSVVIPVYNRADFIEHCLLSVIQQNFFGDYEIIVVDDGSTDGTGEILKKFLPKIRLHVHEKNQGVSSARNSGIRLSQGRYIVMIDSDCKASPDWLEKIIQPFDNDREIMIVGGYVSDVTSSNYWQIVNKGLNTFVSKSNGIVKGVIGCNLALRREFALQNPYDEHLGFAAADETELCLRCRNLGFKVYYIKEASVMHYHRSKFKDCLVQQFFYGYHNTYVSFRYYSYPCVGFHLKFLFGVFLCAGVCLLGLMGYWRWALAGLLIVSYSPWYYNGCSGVKNLTEKAITYPGYYILYISFCLGCLVYFLSPHAFLKRSKV